MSILKHFEEVNSSLFYMEMKEPKQISTAEQSLAEIESAVSSTVYALSHNTVSPPCLNYS